MSSTVSLADLIGLLAPLIFVFWKERIYPGSSREPSDVNDETILIEASSRLRASISDDDYNNLNWHATFHFAHQVAGHTDEVLRQINGKILKPKVKHTLFLRELSYYEGMQSCGSHLTNSVNPYTPKYFGCANLTQTPGAPTLSHLVLEDLTYHCQRPCAMDVKMGTQTFEPTATEAKRNREQLKYCYQSSIGFRITGFKVFSVSDQRYYHADKHFGRSLKPEIVQDALSIFFFNGLCLRRDVIREVIAKLEKILAWFKSQTQHHFFCSSILIVYDGHISNYDGHSSAYLPANLPQRASVNGNQIVASNIQPFLPRCIGLLDSWDPGAGSEKSVVEVRMIDFAHIVPTQSYLTRPTIDEGYIHGLTNLMKALQSIVRL